MKDYWNNL